MTRVVVFGGSGFAGSHIVEAAAVRGLDVLSVTRKESATQIAGARYRMGSLLDAADRARALEGADVVVVAVSARRDMAGQVRGGIALLATDAAAAGVRLAVIGGAGSLRVSEGGPLACEAPGFSPEFYAEAREMADTLSDLKLTDPSLDWLYVSPAAEFGPANAGEFQGEYRVGGDVALVGEDGSSSISGADFGEAVVDELEMPEHHRTQITFAY